MKTVEDTKRCSKQLKKEKVRARSCLLVIESIAFPESRRVADGLGAVDSLAERFDGTEASCCFWLVLSPLSTAGSKAETVEMDGRYCIAYGPS